MPTPIINITGQSLGHCTIIEQHLDMTFYPFLIAIFLAYIFIDVIIFEHKNRWSKRTNANAAIE